MNKTVKTTEKTQKQIKPNKTITKTTENKTMQIAIKNY